jgi:hypothetical protein
VECPKCGRVAAKGAFICAGCDFILDASFLGDDITDDERDKRAVARKGRRNDKPKFDFGADAMILGNPDELEVSEFHSRDAGVSNRETTQARFYIGGPIAQLMQENAVPEVAVGNAKNMRLTPFERHVLDFVDGKRSIARIAKKVAVDDSEFKTAVAMLADKGFIRLKGFKKNKTSKPSSSNLPAAAPTTMPTRAARPSPADRTVVVSQQPFDAVAQPAASPAPASGRTRSKKPPRPADHEATRVAEMPLPPEALPTHIAQPDAAIVRASTPTQFASLAAAKALRAARPVQDEWRSATNGSLIRDEAPASREPLPSLVDVDPDDVFSLPDASADVVVDEPEAGFGRGLVPEVSTPRATMPDDASLTRVRTEAPRLNDLPTRAVASVVASNDDPGAAFDPGDFEAPTYAQLKDPTGIGDMDPPAVVPQMGAAVEDLSVVVGNVVESIVESLPGDVVVGVLADEPPPQNPDEAVTLETAGAPPRAMVSPPPALTSLPDHSAALWGRDGGHAFARADDAMSPLQGFVARAGPQEQAQGRRPANAFDPSPPSGPPPWLPLPGQGLPIALPGQAWAPTTPLPESPEPPATLPLPGQGLVSPAEPQEPVAAAVVGPRRPGAHRVSAGSQVPFELRKKAERIYEEALKDQLEGNIASAIMNAKLAMTFDPTVAAYRELYDELQRARLPVAQSPAARAQLPREFVLFEHANEAEGRGEYERAVKFLTEAVELNPRAAVLHNKLGVVLSIRLKRHADALVYLKQAVDLEPGSVVYMNNFSKVTGLLESMMQKDPKDKKRGMVADDAGPVAIKKIRPVRF